MINNSINFLLNRYGRLSRLYASDGTTLKQITHTRSYSQQTSASDGDKLQTFFICDGTETKLETSTTNDPNAGKFDLYINNVLDSSGYDTYGASTNWNIALTQPIIKGLNTVELRVNGKNGSSGGYYILCGGISLQ